MIVSIWVGMWLSSRRERRRWDMRNAADRREQELKLQLWDLEEQIREERLSEEEREWRRYREEQAEVKRAARRRLGLPEEEPRC